VVPPGWYDAFEEITSPLAELNPRWPFTLDVNPYPGVRPVSPGGTDASSFAKEGIPLVNFRQETDYSYMRAWHTLYDIYSELVPYTEHQEHSALATAVVAYGIANLDEPLTRDGVYLPDGLFADMVTAKGARIMASLDYQNAPLQVANFIRIAEGNAGPPPRRYGGGGGGATVGQITEVGGSVALGLVESDTQASMMVPDLPLKANPALKHDGPGVFGVSGPNAFYFTLAADASLDSRYTALGRVVAGLEKLSELASGDGIRSIRIIRSGEAATAFATDDASFQSLLGSGR
jgi:cyclophilin family peptidyl-prolyl cis-trans isomerase